MTEPTPRVAVLMTCHNRRDATLRCLTSLAEARRSETVDCDLQVFLVDDGSTDWTSQSVAANWPSVNLIEGSGSLYWAGGMALAERTARSDMPDATHLLWLNDDVMLDPDSIASLLRTAAARPNSIIVGAMRDGGGALSYSGVRFPSRWHPLRFARVQPQDVPVEVEAMNGNLVLVPARVASALGGIDDGFKQQAADFDYGLRARSLGASVLLAPGTLGECPRNPAPAVPDSVRQRWRAFNDPVGLATAEQIRFIRRHGPIWSQPLLVAVPYLQFVAGELARLPLVGRLIPKRALRAPRT